MREDAGSGSLRDEETCSGVKQPTSQKRGASLLHELVSEYSCQEEPEAKDSTDDELKRLLSVREAGRLLLLRLPSCPKKGGRPSVHRILAPE